MKKNRMGKYNEGESSDSYEEVIDLDSGEIQVEAKKDVRAKYLEMISWAEGRRGFPFLKEKTLKQFKAFAIAKKNGIDPSKLKERWCEFEKDKFWQEKGFDWMDVINSFNKKQ